MTLHETRQEQLQRVDEFVAVIRAKRPASPLRAENVRLVFEQKRLTRAFVRATKRLEVGAGEGQPDSDPLSP